MNQQEKTIVVAWLLVIATASVACGTNDTATLTELQRLTSGNLDVVLLSSREAIRHGKDTFFIEFRSTPGNLVDVGMVRGNATMPMPGMPMFGSLEVKRTDVTGRYEAQSDFGMAGTWRMTIQWDGSAGQGSVTFSGTVQ